MNSLSTSGHYYKAFVENHQFNVILSYFEQILDKLLVRYHLLAHHLHHLIIENNKIVKIHNNHGRCVPKHYFTPTKASQIVEIKCGIHQLLMLGNHKHPIWESNFPWFSYDYVKCASCWFLDCTHRSSQIVFTIEYKVMVIIWRQSPISFKHVSLWCLLIDLHETTSQSHLGVQLRKIAT